MIVDGKRRIFNILESAPIKAFASLENRIMRRRRFGKERGGISWQENKNLSFNLPARLTIATGCQGQAQTSFPGEMAFL